MVVSNSETSVQQVAFFFGADRDEYLGVFVFRKLDGSKADTTSSGVDQYRLCIN